MQPRWVLLTATAALAGCGRFNFDPTDGVGADGEVAVVNVSPLGGRWNSYAEASDLSIPCDTEDANAKYDDCKHLGELRQVVVAGETDCTAWELDEELDAFNWSCEQQPDALHFVTTGLRFGLRDLVDDVSWMPNRVTLRRGTRTLRSPFAVWWDNPVLPLPDNSSGAAVVLDNGDAVYVLATSRATHGYELGADGMSIVTLGDATLTMPAGTATNCGGTQRCVLAARDRRRVWIEIAHDVGPDVEQVGAWLERTRYGSVFRLAQTGFNAYAAVRVIEARANRVANVSAGRAVYAVDVSDSDGNKLEHVSMTNSFAGTIELVRSSDNWISDIRSTNDDASSIGIYQSHRNHVENARISISEGAAIDLVDANDNTIVDVAALDGDGPGVELRNSQRNTVASFMVQGNGVRLSSSSDNSFVDGVIAASKFEDGITLAAAPRNTFAFLTVANHTTDGINLDASPDNRFHSIVVANVTGAGITTNVSGNVVFDDLVVAHADGGLVNLDGSPGTAFHGAFIHSSGSCTTANGATGIDALCAPTTPSTATDVGGVDLVGTLVGPIADEDRVNTADTGGGATLGFTNPSWPVGELDQLFVFEHRYRAWGADQPWHSTAARTRCREAALGAQPCRIWDYRVRDGDDVIRRRAGLATAENPIPTAGAPCPAFVHGDAAATDARTPPQTFLRHARELTLDFVGDDDGLCESGETCVVAPTPGVYQGESDLEQGCTFEDGVVSGVTLVWFPRDGAPV